MLGGEDGKNCLGMLSILPPYTGTFHFNKYKLVDSSFAKYLLSSYCVLGTMLGARDSGTINKTLATLSDLASSREAPSGQTTDNESHGCSCAIAPKGKNEAA